MPRASLPERCRSNRNGTILRVVLRQHLRDAAVNVSSRGQYAQCPHVTCAYFGQILFRISLLRRSVRGPDWFAGNRLLKI